ncbi:MAG TPA: hypothetical protein VE826_02705 [Dongiaceae bacterium]|nr:hypothetical protein [Dongiaceae bacterium]
MMTHANAAPTNATDSVSAARAIAENARRNANRPTEHPGMAGVIALAAGILLSLGVIGTMAVSPAAIPSWCATHSCPTAPTLPHAM